MRKVDFGYLEVLNETEQLMIFTVTFNNELYGVDIVLNTALSIEVQDIQLRRAITKAKNMTRKDIL